MLICDDSIPSLRRITRLEGTVRLPKQREESLGELQKSLTYIENSLTTSISFEGNAPNLLIDELQFLLDPGCITIDSPEGAFANILPEEKKLLLAFTERFSWDNCKGASERVVVRHKKFPRISELDIPNDPPLRLALIDVNGAHEFVLTSPVSNSSWKLSIYYNSDKVSIPFCEFPEFNKYVGDALQSISKFFSPNQAKPHKKLERLYYKFQRSHYLERVLEALRDRIVQHLSSKNRLFAQFTRDKFFLQFFLVSEDPDSADPKHWLRFFPLQDQKDEIEDPLAVERISKNLQAKNLIVPADIAKFIAEDYLWNSDRSFVGYSFDTEASLYLTNWEEEPRARGVHLSVEDQTQRSIATTIMQTLRRETPNLFIFPLFANKQTIGVAVINCPIDIDPSARVGPIRSARDLGFLISLALQTDDVVNHLQAEKEKAAQVMSYKHATQSIMHEERSYCMELESFVETLRKKYPVDSDAEISPRIDLISFIVRDKLELVDEFAASDDPIRTVPQKFLYPSMQTRQPPVGVADVSIEELTSIVQRLNRLYNIENRLRSIELELGASLRQTGGIADFSSLILSRVLGNLIRNSVAQAKKKDSTDARLQLSMEIIDDEQKRVLEIRAEDNCGGFEDQNTPRDITFDSWMQYLNSKKIRRGKGFLILSKYASASGGACRVENIEAPQRGARVTISIGLQRNATDPWKAFTPSS
jgi:signal transduction histidine kinase